MLSPFLPSLQALPQEPVKQAAIDLAIEDDEFDDNFEWDFPFITDAQQFLVDKRIVTNEQFRAMAADDRRFAFSVSGGADAVSRAAALRDRIAAAIESGQSRDDFVDEVASAVNVQENELKTLFRTATKQAYIAGKETTLNSPEVADEFPYVMFVATQDTRVRKHHEALDGKVCLRSSPMYKTMRDALDEYNCRCDIIPLDRTQAARYGVTDKAPPSVKKAVAASTPDADKKPNS